MKPVNPRTELTIGDVISGPEYYRVSEWHYLRVCNYLTDEARNYSTNEALKKTDDKLFNDNVNTSRRSVAIEIVVRQYAWMQCFNTTKGGEFYAFERQVVSSQMNSEHDYDKDRLLSHIHF